MTLKTIDTILLLANLMLKENGATISDMSTALRCSVRSLYRLIKIMYSFDIPIRQTLDRTGNTNSKRWKIIDSEWWVPIELKSDPRSILVCKLLQTTIATNTRGGGTSEITEIHESLRNKDILRTLTADKFKFIKTTYTTFKGYKDYSDKEDILESLSKSIKKQIALTITYQSPKNQSSKQYIIHPYTIVSHDNGLYLLAAIPKHDGRVIVLAIERIISIDNDTGDSFMIPESYDPETYLNEAFGITHENPIPVKVRFDRDSSLYASERIWGKDQIITSNEDGSIIVSFIASGLTEISRWVMSYGSHARVIGPKVLIDEVRKETRGLEAMYQ